jgi:hypothetical protein
VVSKLQLKIYIEGQHPQSKTAYYRSTVCWLPRVLYFLWNTSPQDLSKNTANVLRNVKGSLRRYHVRYPICTSSCIPFVGLRPCDANWRALVEYPFTGAAGSQFRHNAFFVKGPIVDVDVRGMFRDGRSSRGLEAVNGHRQIRFEVRTRYIQRSSAGSILRCLDEGPR